MTHHFRPLGVVLLVLVLILAGSARAQSFSNFFVFGASLSDTGNIAQYLELPAGSSFTTNPDPLAVEIIAQTFGASGRHSLAGGPNYAWSGACVRPEGPCLNPVPTITEQIDQHLFTRPGGRADPDALYFVWAGLNDINDALILDSAAAQTHTLDAATSHAAQVRRIQDAGARYIVVPNLPDLSLIPFASNLPPHVRGALTALSAAYNDVVYAGLRVREDGIIPINISVLTEEILESHQTYGFTNVRETACPLNENPLTDRSPVSLVCGPEGSGYPKTYAPGANQRHLFADDKHPTGAAHAIIGSAVTSTVTAPVQVSLAGEAGIDVARIHSVAVSTEQLADFVLERPVGSWRGYATGGIGRHESDVLPHLGETQADMQVLTLGASRRSGTNLYLGAALSLARHDNDVSGANLDSTVALGSLHGTWRGGGLYLRGALSWGETWVDIERSIRLGPAVRPERGDTSANLLGAELDLGWIFGEASAVQHGPFLGVAWIDQEVKGYRESGRSSTSMDFSDFERESLIGRGGYWLTGRFGRWISPYARFTYEREFEDGPVRVTAGSNTMPGRFTLPGFTPPRQSASASFGLTAELTERVNAVAGYNGRFGDGSRRDHQLSLLVRIAF